MKNSIACILLILLLPAVHSFASGTQLINYPAPEGAEAANDFELEINGQKVFVYNTRSAAYAYCSFEGKPVIKVKPGAFIYSYA